MVRGFFSFRTFFYLIYAVILTAVLLYIRFPTEKFRLFCEKRVESFFSNSVCSIDRIAYHFPLSLDVSHLQITQGGDEGHASFQVNRLTITPDSNGGFRIFSINGEIYGGRFSLKLDIDGEKKSFQLNEVLITGFNVDEWTKDFALLGRKVSGVVEYSGDYQATFESPLAGVGKGKLAVVDGSMELIQPILSLSLFEFTRMDVEMTHENGLVKFAKGEVSGNEINANFTGEVRTTSPLQNSTILLSGHLAPEEGFLAVHPEEQKLVEQLLRRYKMAVLPFKIGGTMGSPIFRFST